MQVIQLLKIAQIAIQTDANAVVDYADQRIQFEGDFSKMPAQTKKELLKKDRIVEITDNTILLEVI